MQFTGGNNKEGGKNMRPDSSSNNRHNSGPPSSRNINNDYSKTDSNNNSNSNATRQLSNRTIPQTRHAPSLECGQEQNELTDQVYLGPVSNINTSFGVEPQGASSIRMPTPTAATKGSSNLANLANIDHQAFFSQQQQMRAELQLKQQQQQQQQLQQQQAAACCEPSQPPSQTQLGASAQQQPPGAMRPSSSPSSMASNECLTSSRSTSTSGSSGASAILGFPQQPAPSPISPDAVTSRNSAQDSINATTTTAAPSSTFFYSHQQQQQQQHHHHQHHLHQHPGQHAMSQSDTTDDIQSLTSQFNIHCATTATNVMQPTSFIQGHGHYFTKKTFHKPTYCHHCADMLWGLIGQGYICEVCNFVVHERCMKTVVSSCSTVASSTIKNPMPHCWTDAHAKRKFCNVCRKRIEDNANAARCSVCEYCVHLECQEFSISDCRECATYVPEQSLSDVKQQHHWREGNLPQIGSKCYWCKKSCYSAECLTGMRCEWCQMTVHASCLKSMSRECNLGSLQTIMLPPYCVSIPRTDVPMETIIGVSNRTNYAANYAFGPGSMTLQMGSGMPASISANQQSGGTTGNCGNCSNTGSTGNTGNTGSTATGPASNASNQHQRRTDNIAARSASEDAGNVSSQGSSLISTHHQSSSGAAPQSSTSSSSFTMQAPSTGSALYHQQQLIFQQQQLIESELILQNRDKDEELLRVYDGNGSLKKRSFRQISIHRSVSRVNLIGACLRAFYIHDDVTHYALFDVSDPQATRAADSCERELDENYPLYFLSGRAGGALKLSHTESSSTAAPLSAMSPSGGPAHSSPQQLNQQQQSQSVITQKSSGCNSNPSSSPAALSSAGNNEPISLLLRYRPPVSSTGFIKVYPGRLNVNAELTYCNLPVTNDTSVSDIMEAALDRFRLRTRETNLNRYRLVEVSLDKGSSVHERTMDNSECPWEIIKNVARESVRQKENTRFYLQQQDEVYCSSVAIFVGNLPSNLSQKQYELMLMEALGKPYRFKSINPIYYEYGSCIITYDNADIAVKAFKRLREANIRINEEVRVPVVLLLPNIVPEMIPDGVRPLLVFVNVKSGGCQGLELITNFRRLLNPYQIYDLENGGPLPGLYVFRKIRDYKILVSGGDGSVGWVLQCLDNVGQDSVCQSPPCAIIPLGTGNDLARVLRWGSGYTGAEDPITFLKDVTDAEEVILDRWTVVFHSDEATNKSDYPSALSISTSSGAAGAEDNAAIFVMNNYLGIGLDAELCLGFHNAREENPDKFNSRLHNKGVYVKQAIRKMVNRGSWNDLKKAMRLEVDGKVVPLPHIEGIIILNILSWGSGANPWGPETDDRFAKPTHYDGMLEVVGLTGIVHMGQIQSGLSRAIRIAQGGRIKIRLNTEMPIQVDGEPWIQPACEMNILRSALKATMLRKTKMKRRNTEPSINQLLDGKLQAASAATASEDTVAQQENQ